MFADNQVPMSADDAATTGYVGAKAVMSAGVPAGRLEAGLKAVGPASLVAVQTAGAWPCCGLANAREALVAPESAAVFATT